MKLRTDVGPPFHVVVAIGRSKVYTESWSVGLLLPEYKKGATSEPINIRPVCILSNSHKLAEY